MFQSQKTALVLLPEGVEEIEAVTPIDLLRRAGVEVLLASLSEDLRVIGRTGIVLGADTSLAAVGDRLFDLLLLPGGPGVRHLRASPAVLDLTRRHAQAHRLIGAICAAPTVLLDAGLLTPGIGYTAHFSVAGELPAARSEAVVRHERILTSRGAGTAVPFGLALIEALFDSEAASKVAAAICYPC